MEWLVTFCLFFVQIFVIFLHLTYPKNLANNFFPLISDVIDDILPHNGLIYMFPNSFKSSFQLSDRGTPQLQQVQWILLDVQRFNFEAPRFIYPAENQQFRLQTVS